MKKFLFICSVITLTLWFKYNISGRGGPEINREISSVPAEKPITRTVDTVQARKGAIGPQQETAYELKKESKENLEPLNEKAADKNLDLILDESFVSRANDEEFAEEMKKKKLHSPLDFYQQSTVVEPWSKTLKKINGIYEGNLLNFGSAGQNEQIRLTVDHKKGSFELVFIKEGRPYMTTSSDGGLGFFIKQQEKTPKSLILETYDKKVFIHITPNIGGVILGNIYKGNKLIGSTRLSKIQ